MAKHSEVKNNVVKLKFKKEPKLFKVLTVVLLIITILNSLKLYHIIG